MAGIIERIKNHIQKIEEYDFECEAGNLRGCKDWIELKKEIDKWEKMELAPVEYPREKNHIEKMEEEAQELEEKIEKLVVFIEREKIEPKFTDEEQRIKLVLQKEYMINYADILRQRIYCDTLKANKDPEVENHIELLQRK